MVEDSTLIRLTVAVHLRTENFTVIEADNADAALGLLSSNDAIDCVFTDVHMPGGRDGIGLTRWILEHRPELPVLLTSGDLRLENLDDDLRSQLAFLPKPYRPHTVVAQLRRLITARRQGPSTTGMH